MATRIGITRRLQALRALGWTTSELARLTGLTPALLRRVTTDPSLRISGDTERRITYHYVQASTRAPSMRNSTERAYRDRIRDGAQARGYAAPFAWTDIDDPGEIPAGMRHPETRGVVGLDEAVLLLQLGVYPGEVAARLGVKRESLARRFRRAGLPAWVG